MSIPVYKVISSLTQVTKLQTDLWLKKIELFLGEPLFEVSIDDYVNEPFGLVFVASGGSEGYFLQIFDRISDKPVYLLTSGESNSLAASMEILAYLQAHGKKGEILHGSAKDVAERINVLNRAYRAKARLNGMKLGCIGAPSDWLIASGNDDAFYREKLNLSVVNIPMEELLEEYNRHEYFRNEWTERLMLLGYDRAEMEKSLWVYGAFKRIVEKYGLGGVTVRCFDLLTAVETTGCLGLAILNAEGIYGGCEGDVPSLVSMAILGEISGQPVFMCNPSRIDTEEGEMVLAHCTLPVNMPEKMRLTTHYESGIGVAIKGQIPEKKITVFKTNAGLDRFFAAKGRIIENLDESVLCRTQIKVKLKNYKYFLKNPIQNHHLICIGNYVDALNAFFELI